MKILVDADALPNMIKEILFRAAERVSMPLTMVSNKNLKIPRSRYISSILVPGGPDVADDRIVELVEELGGRVVGLGFLIELSFLPGRKKLEGYDVFSLIDYKEE